MSSISIAGDTSGSIILQAPAVAGSSTLTLPATTGTVLTNASPAITTPTITGNILNASGRPMVAQTGSVLQVVTGTTTSGSSTASTSFAATNLTVSITPSTTSSKILILASGESYVTASGVVAVYTLYRGSVTSGGTNLGNPTWGFCATYSASGGATAAPMHMSYLDSPATTSSVSYTVGFRSNNGTAVSYLQDGEQGVITLLEIAA
jgi:hypothetical protein